jgi:hypothetical protein
MPRTSNLAPTSRRLIDAVTSGVAAYRKKEDLHRMMRSRWTRPAAASIRRSPRDTAAAEARGPGCRWAAVCRARGAGWRSLRGPEASAASASVATSRRCARVRSGSVR